MHNLKVVALVLFSEDLLREDFSLGDSLLGALRNCFEEGRGEVSICVTLVKGEYLHPTHGLAKCSVSHEEQMSPLAILVFF